MCPPSQYLATNFLPGVPPYLPNFKFIFARCSLRWDANLHPALLPVTVGVCEGGVGLSDPCRKFLSRGSPLFAESEKMSRPVAVSAGTPIASLPPPSVPVGLRGGVGPLQTLWPKFCQGFPYCGRISNFFSWNVAGCITLRGCARTVGAYIRGGWWYGGGGGRLLEPQI